MNEEHFRKVGDFLHRAGTSTGDRAVGRGLSVCLSFFSSILVVSHFMWSTALDLQLWYSAIIFCNTNNISHDHRTRTDIYPLYLLNILFILLYVFQLNSHLRSRRRPGCLKTSLRLVSVISNGYCSIMLVSYFLLRGVLDCSALHVP